MVLNFIDNLQSIHNANTVEMCSDYFLLRVYYDELCMYFEKNVKLGRLTLMYGRKGCCQRTLKRQLRRNSTSFFRIMDRIQVFLQHKQSLGERNELSWFFLTCCFAALHTRIVVPQFENSLMEMCREAEVSSPSFITSLYGLNRCRL